MAIGITGASGFLGGYLSAAFARDGVPVVRFARDVTTTGAGVQSPVRSYELGGVPDLDGIDSIVHCAFALRRDSADDGIALNVDGTAALFAAAQRHGIKFSFVSSISAGAPVESAYARQKRAIEALLGDRGLALRPGLIAGDGGFFATLRALAARRLVPLVDGGRQLVQLVAVEDVYGALRLALDRSLTGPHNVVAEPALTVRDVITRLSRGACGPRFIGVPFAFAFAVAATAERFGVSLPVTTENLRGLRGATVQQASEALRALGWRPEPATAVLERIASNGSA